MLDCDLRIGQYGLVCRSKYLAIKIKLKNYEIKNQGEQLKPYLAEE